MKPSKSRVHFVVASPVNGQDEITADNTIPSPFRSPALSLLSTKPVLQPLEGWPLMNAG